MNINTPSSGESRKAASHKRKRSDVDKGSTTSEKLARGIGIHRCEFCPRTFNSGKALGGHKRYCQLQTQRKEREANNNIGDDNNNNIVGCNGAGMTKSSSCKGIIKTTCRICKRNFPSNKSLYGHMRTHTKDSPNHHHNNSSQLLRGKRVCSGAATQILMCMSQDMPPPRIACMTVKKNDDGDDDEDQNARAIKLVVKLPSTALKGNLKGVQRDLYNCGICGKSFSTSQALGGHISSHYKDKEKNDKDSESFTTSQYYDPEYYDSESESSSAESISCQNNEERINNNFLI